MSEKITVDTAKPRHNQITLRVSEEEMRALKVVADKNSCTISDLIRHYMKPILERGEALKGRSK